MLRGRVQWFHPDEMTSEQRALYDTIVTGPRSTVKGGSELTDEDGRLNGPHNALLLDPAVGDAVQNLGASIRFSSSLSRRCIELATLQVAAAQRSNYEWYAHRLQALRCGFTEEEIDAVRGAEPCDTFAADEQLVRRVVDCLIADKDLDDASFETAHQQLGDQAVFDLIVLVGFYELLARHLRVWRTPSPETYFSE